MVGLIQLIISIIAICIVCFEIKFCHSFRFEGEISYTPITVLRLLIVMKIGTRLLNDQDSKNNDVQIGSLSNKRNRNATELDKCIEVLMNNMEQRSLKAAAKIIENMMDHNEDRMVEYPDIWSFEKEFIIDFIQQKLDLADYFTEKEIQRCAGVLSTNATNLQLKGNFGKGIGLYPIYSMMNHSCV